MQRIVLCPAIHIPWWVWTAGHEIMQKQTNKRTNKKKKKKKRKKKKHKKKNELHINTISAFCTAVVPIVVVGISAGVGYHHYVNPF